jgi:hypothetical protein
MIKRCFPLCILLLPAEMRFPLDAMDRELGAMERHHDQIPDLISGETLN